MEIRVVIPLNGGAFVEQLKQSWYEAEPVLEFYRNIFLNIWQEIGILSKPIWLKSIYLRNNASWQTFWIFPSSDIPISSKRSWMRYPKNQYGWIDAYILIEILAVL